MTPLPTQDLRSNLGTWAVTARQLPAVAQRMVDALGLERFDPYFRGQDLETTYFDTPDFRLLKARKDADRYLTLRLRCYRTADGETYALSAKTEGQKFRKELPAAAAEAYLTGVIGQSLVYELPGDLQARALALLGDEPLVPVATVCCRRYAVEDSRDRLTLDCDVHTDTGKHLPYGVLEFKSTQDEAQPPGSLAPLGLRPLKLSKFLWALRV